MNNECKFVIKLGGSSQTKKGYDNLIRYIDKSKKYVIVLSAIKNTTNNLIDFIGLVKDKNPNAFNFLEEKIIDQNKNLAVSLDLEDISFLDYEFNFLRHFKDKEHISLQEEINIVSIGETLTARILYNFLKLKKFNCKFLDAKEIIYCEEENDSLFNSKKFKINCDNLKLNLINHNIIIVPGFRGRDKNNNISIMSRGGSDTTGSLISSSLEVEKYQIWTDVDGLYSADPRNIKNAQIINSINYQVAQEVAAMGAKILHPYCIRPCQEKNVPIEIKNTFSLENKGTLINNKELSHNSICCITNQEDVSMFKVESLDMWNNYGFVCDIYSEFRNYNADVNIISTSQFDITTTISNNSNLELNSLRDKLSENYNVELTENCNIISIVGQNIKKFNKIGAIMKAIIDFDIKLTSYSSNDMTLSFVVKKEIANDLVNCLHKLIFPFNSFELKEDIWWKNLLDKNGPNKCQYLYNLEVVKNQVNKLKKVSSIDKIFYAMKANNNVDILNYLNNIGFGFETVTLDEIDYLLNNLNKLDNVQILYTPNFANISDYTEVFEKNQDIKVIVDNISIIINYPSIFKNKKIGLRLDLDYGFGHCNKVITQGQDSKFGMTCYDILDNIKLFRDNNIIIDGLHSHMGSGINDYKHWIKNLELILKVYDSIPNELNNIKWLDIGGGLGLDLSVNDLESLNNGISKIKSNYKNLNIFIEPGRYIVAESGIIWGKVTQIKSKNNTKFIGTNVGMTDIMRPVLYSSIHPVYFNQKTDKFEIATIVGPICESGDVLIKNLKVPNNIKVNDSIIVTNSGAYGIVMASNYNNRKLPQQFIF